MYRVTSIVQTIRKKWMDNSIAKYLINTKRKESLIRVYLITRPNGNDYLSRF